MASWDSSNEPPVTCHQSRMVMQFLVVVIVVVGGCNDERDIMKKNNDKKRPVNQEAKCRDKMFGLYLTLKRRLEPNRVKNSTKRQQRDVED